ncbi:ATP-binding cassette domain-containing protein [Streptomyces sodiiphilus]|uniref:ATP-binding cassette domain-containing protein n=1 Tax=Streptomyces sodiiphilus TaxID=226217 RepID=UPI0031D1D801
MNGLHQGYRGKPVLRGVSLSLEKGVYGLLGPNGAGKSTLLRVLATAAAPQEGTLRLFGGEVRTRGEVRAARRRIGWLPQSFGCPPAFTVEDFVRHCAWLREIPAGRIPEETRTALARVDLLDQARTPMRKLSGGMVRRAGIAQATLGSPAVVLLDEPTTGLDPRQRMQFRSMLRELGGSACVVLSTHIVEDLAHSAPRLGVLHGGRVVFDGTPRELADLAHEQAPGDTPLEQGYSVVLGQDTGLSTSSGAHG